MGRRAGSKEQGARSKEQGVGGKEQGARSRVIIRFAICEWSGPSDFRPSDSDVSLIRSLSLSKGVAGVEGSQRVAALPKAL